MQAAKTLLSPEPWSTKADSLLDRVTIRVQVSVVQNPAICTEIRQDGVFLGPILTL